MWRERGMTISDLDRVCQPETKFATCVESILA
jgi:hypothetical protein